MLIKLASSRQHTDECPEDKLKFISYTDSVHPSKPLRLVSVEHNHQPWVMDAWDNLVQDPYHSPQRRPQTQRQEQHNSIKNIRIKKTGNSIDRSEVKSKNITTPLKSGLQGFEKENSNQMRMQMQKRQQRRVQSNNDESRQLSPYKVPLNSILYPVIRTGQCRSRNRRMDRFHSFVARTIRK